WVSGRSFSAPPPPGLAWRPEGNPQGLDNVIPLPLGQTLCPSDDPMSCTSNIGPTRPDPKGFYSWTPMTYLLDAKKVSCTTTSRKARPPIATTTSPSVRRSAGHRTRKRAEYLDPAVGGTAVRDAGLTPARSLRARG